ncbi:hypothetical protein F383_26643 [Gossypium arboreum]|uniref:Uncharacterized protein n=1 Tax=Gossypium arboreum TaxID=29729 RepID=A0A0B0MT68_GOSAR|nr:hypothetical protein F383_26643 [Gossypium arboreum]
MRRISIWLCYEIVQVYSASRAGDHLRFYDTIKLS